MVNGKRPSKDSIGLSPNGSKIETGSSSRTDLSSIGASLAIDPFRGNPSMPDTSFHGAFKQLGLIPKMSGFNASDATSSITANNGNSGVDWRASLRDWLTESSRDPDHPFPCLSRDSDLWRCITNRIDYEWSEKEAKRKVARIQELRRKRHDLLRGKSQKDQIDALKHQLFALTKYEGYR